MNPATLTATRPDRSLTTADKLARGLGWFSLGLGIAELVAPGKIARALGLEGKENLLRAYGGREIVAGVGVLSVDTAPAMWSRVAGDLVDLGTLSLGLKGDQDQQRNAKIAIGAVLGITALDILVAATLTKQRSRTNGESRDYSDRSGFPGGATQARGVAGDFEMPSDMKAVIPEPPSYAPA